MRGNLCRAGITVLTAVALLMVGGCPNPKPAGGDGNDGGSGTGTNLVRFGSAQELLQYFKDHATANARATGGFLTMGIAPMASGAAATGNSAADSAESGTATTESFSTTNLQEAGVDESDVIKSDGTHFYVAKDHSVRVIAATPSAAMAEGGGARQPR